MREILFRGKTADKAKEWIEGFVFNEKHDKFGYYNNCAYFWIRDVIPETVGQFTGLTDKNGKKIFEGDIVVTRYPKGDICSIGDVQFKCGVFGAEWTVHKKYQTMIGTWGQRHNLRRFDDDIIENIEVIGNIHDNPELLTKSPCQNA